MSLNVSNSSFTDPLHHVMKCFIIRPNSFIYAASNLITILLLLPLCSLVFYLGLKRRCSTSAAETSHSDVFTYNMVAMEMSNISGCLILFCGLCLEDLHVLFVGQISISFSWFGETFFHLLTCLERYLAVVHPVTYLSLRGERGIRIRNVCIGCVWLICCVSIGRFRVKSSVLLVMDLFFLIFCLIVISFCSLSVICTLVRPRPGEQGGDRVRVNQSKKRACYTIMAILGVLVLRCVANMLLWVNYLIFEDNECSLLLFGVWLYIPSSLVLPLLFIHRAGILACCKN